MAYMVNISYVIGITYIQSYRYYLCKLKYMRDNNSITYNSIAYVTVLLM